MALLRAAVVGVGHLGQHHARLWSEVDGARLVGVMDTDRARAEEIAGRHGARVFDDVESLAAEVDVASVATPTVAHESSSVPLLERGVSVLVEKPIAPDIAAGRRMERAAAAGRAALMVGHTERFHPAVSRLLERIDRPRFVEIHRLAQFKPRSLDVDVLLDLMIHDLDLSRLIAGRRALVRFEASGTPALTDRIDIASVRLRFEGGIAANLTASRISNEPVRRIRVFEPGAYFACDTAQSSLLTCRLSAGGAEPRIDSEMAEFPPEEPLRREIEAFRDAVVGGLRVPCPAEDGLAALDLALRIGAAIDEDLAQHD